MLPGDDRLEGSRRERDYIDLRGDSSWTKTEARARGMRVFCNVGWLLGDSIFRGYARMGLLHVGECFLGDWVVVIDVLSFGWEVKVSVNRT